MTITSAPEEEMLTIHFRVNGGWTLALSRKLGCDFGADPRRSSAQRSIINSTNVTNAISHKPPMALLYDQDARKSSESNIDLSKRDDIIQPGSTLTSSDGDAPNPANTTSVNQGKVTPSPITDMSRMEMGTGMPIVSEAANVPTIFVDGPYPAPTEHFFEYKVGILIAAGIGITPAAAVLQSMYLQWHHRRDQVQQHKIYLFWIYRDAGMIECFKDRLELLSKEGLDTVVEAHTYFTGALSETCGPRPVQATDPFGEEVIDNAIGTSSYVGRPDFESIFQAIGMHHPDSRIGAFLCGPKPMARQVRRIAHRWDRRFRKRNNTMIDFHSETF
ncbi:hypothetical protein H4R20_001652 [Coemansia guatemalensis]|uniref:Ferric reductase NAD binding domain-containing protein n=1 Tax=Coemansia guatemalensis TaxID=2761395 RepID=A0A9W8LUC7_9FUNG|nr:hypothetical protein H4R20_001652 [Coemansia guatemalensis]